MATGKPRRKSKTRGSPPHRPQQSQLHFFRLTFIFGIVLILVGLYLTYQETILSFTTPPTPQVFVNKRSSPPVRIRIDTAGIDLPIDVGWIRGGTWDISPKNASHLATSAHPGEAGNIVIYGHNKETIFGKLKQVKRDDQVSLETTEGTTYNYRVTDITQVTPNQIEVVLPTNYEVLTVYTCTGFLDSKRLVLRAVPLR